MNREVILGINGYSKRTHDASACVVIDGELISMSEEERFTRRKNAFGQVPHNAIASSLHDAGITLRDVDTVAVGWDFDKVFANMGKSGPSKDDLAQLYFPENRFPGPKPDIELVPHHLAHAASAYYLSGYDNSLVLVMDGQGENQSTTIFSASGDVISKINEFPVKDSLGYFYEAVSEYVGLSRLDGGKTMGLASYGDPRYGFDLLKLTDSGYAIGIESPTQVEMDLQQEITDAWMQYLESVFGPKNREHIIFDSNKSRFKRQVNLTQYFKDVAASAQKTLEQTIIQLIRTNSPDGSLQNLCIAGGVGLNCSMNGVVAREGIVQDLFVPPFTNDSGVSAGAALFVSDRKRKVQLDTASLGPKFSNDDVLRALSAFGIKYETVENMPEKVAQLLAEGEIVDLFQGRMEVGPRALGNRSIIGNPTQRITHNKLNDIKNREQWRPLAPSFLAESLGDFMTDPSNSPFMLRAFNVKPEMKDIVPAAVHIDGTSRAQTVTAANNPVFRAIIEKFAELTGVPAVMNTSFNLDDEPIVGSPTDALRTFFSSGANYLAIENALVSKK